MATAPLQADSACANPARDLVGHASELENIIRDASALISAINLADLFEGTRETEDERDRQQIGFSLLDMARRRLLDADKILGSELSIKLSVLADREVRHG